MSDLAKRYPLPRLTVDREAVTMGWMSEDASESGMGPRLKTMREAGGIAATDVARLMKDKGWGDLDRSTISRFEAGTLIKSAKFISDYFDSIMEIGEKRARALGLIE